MSINNTQSDNTTGFTNEPKLVNLRFSLRRLLSKTALADIYWSNDLHGVTEDMPEKNVLVMLVHPAITRLKGFPHAWQQVLSRPAPPATAYPDIIDFGEDKGNHWLALNNINGMLLSERINELNHRGLPLDTVLDTLENINQTLSSIQAGAFGYIEPGAIQQTDRGYKILNAPLVKVLQQIVASERSTINKLALHSSYLSPSVAVGDIPVTEDDSFSTASMLYALLTGKSPFGEQSTLTAVAHGDVPAPLKQLKKTSWEALEQALAYQRSARPENPEKLLSLLKESNKRRIAFPLAVLAALGVTVFAGQHLISRISDYLPADNSDMQQAATEQNTRESPLIAAQPTSPTIPSTTTEAAKTTQQLLTPATTEEDKKAKSIAAIELVNEPATGKASENEPETKQETATAKIETEPDKTQIETTTAALTEPPTESEPLETNTTSGEDTSLTQDTTSTGTSTETVDTAESITSETTSSEKLDQLLKQAVASFNKGQLEDHTDGAQGAISLLREALKLDEDNTDATVLLGKVVEKRYQAAEQHIQKSDFETAENLLSESDNLIREFMLTEKLQRQVKLESKITILRQEQKQIDKLLASARKAIKRGDISKDDSTSANALTILSRVMFKQPGNKNGQKLIDEIVVLRQQAIRQALDNNELEKAATYLGENERLIRKYKLKTRKADQQLLEFAYQAAMIQPQTAITEQSSENIEVITLTPETNLNTQTGLAADTDNKPPANQVIMQPVPAPENTSFAETLPAVQPALPDTAFPVEKPEPNPIGIQASRIEEMNIDSELLQPEQVFIPEATPGTASAQTTPIWETDNLQQIQQDGQPVVIYDPNINNQQYGQTTLPQNNNAGLIAPTRPVVSYVPATPNNNQPQAMNIDQTNSILPDDLPILVPQEEFQQIPVVTEFLPPVSAADQQAMSNVQIPLGEMVPELLEIPVSAIEEILPVQ